MRVTERIYEKMTIVWILSAIASRSVNFQFYFKYIQRVKTWIYARDSLSNNCSWKCDETKGEQNHNKQIRGKNRYGYNLTITVRRHARKSRTKRDNECNYWHAISDEQITMSNNYMTWSNLIWRERLTTNINFQLKGKIRRKGSLNVVRNKRRWVCFYIFLCDHEFNNHVIYIYASIDYAIRFASICFFHHLNCNEGMCSGAWLAGFKNQFTWLL